MGFTWYKGTIQTILLTLYDVSSNKKPGFHIGQSEGLEQTGKGDHLALRDMLREILDDIKAKGFTIRQIIIDYDTSETNIACSSFPEVHITYCGKSHSKGFS